MFKLLGISADLWLGDLTCFGLAITCVLAEFSILFDVLVVVFLNGESDKISDADNEVLSNSLDHPFKVTNSGSPPCNVD